MALPSASRHVALRRAVALVCTAPWLAWAVVRGFSLDARAPLTLAIPFTPYAALTSPVPVVVALVLRRPGVALLALAPAVALCAFVAPRAFGGGATPDGFAPGPTYTVMSLNMDDGRADPRTILRLVREHRVDALALVEVKDGLVGLDMVGIRDELPRRLERRGARGGGDALLTRAALEPLGGDKLDRRYEEPPRGLVRRDGAALPLALEVVHPPHPTRPWFEREWHARFAALPAAGADDRLQVLLGDFNATLDHRVLRRLVDRGYTDAADATGEGLHMTWPTNRRVPEIAIDHVLADRRISVDAFHVEDVPRTDHRAVIARLTLPRAG